MTLVVEKMHIMQIIDWTRFDLESWLHQFGAWMRSTKGTCGRYANPIAIAMNNVVKVQKFKRLSKDQKEQVIVDYLSGDFQPLKIKNNHIICQINDNEARAVQRLILDMLGQSEIMDDWMDAIIDRYFYGNSWAEMVTDERSQMDARMDVKCGLAALHSRYGFIRF